MWAVQAGTAVSSRVRAEAPNSVNLIRIERTAGAAAAPGAAPKRRARVERWDHVAASGTFECVAVHRLPGDDER